MSFSSIVIILALALILFGPEDLPVVARTIGKIVYQIRRATGELTKEFQGAFNEPLNAAKSYSESINNAGRAVKEPFKAVTETIYKTTMEAKQVSEGHNSLKTENGDTVETELPHAGNADYPETASHAPEELLKYEDEITVGDSAKNPLDELPEDMVINEEKGTSR